MEKKFLNFAIFGKENSGKCSLNEAINLYIKNLTHLKDFTYNNTKYHLFPIPCCGQDLKDNFDISIKNSDFILITIDSTTIDNIKQDQEYYSHLILLSIINGINKIIFVLTKTTEKETKSLEQDIQKLKSFINDIYNLIQNKFNENGGVAFSYVAVDSLEGEGIEELLKQFPTYKDIITNNNNFVLFGLYDKYQDKERDEFVMTCKVSNVGSINYNIAIDETKLFLYYMDDKKFELNCIKNLIPFKLSLANGEYVSKMENLDNQFISFKFRLNSVEENYQNNPLKNCFLSLEEKNNNICFFDTFEGDIFISAKYNDDILKDKAYTIITKGCKCIFSSYNYMGECTIASVVGEYENSKELVKKKIINCKNGICAKVVINLSNPILSTKYEICHKFGSFCLLKEGEIFAIGKIIKYKPKK